MDIDHNNEKPIIFVVVTFFLALTLIYIAFFRTQGTYTTTIDNSTENSTTVTDTSSGSDNLGDIISNKTSGNTTISGTTIIAQQVLSSMINEFITLSSLNQSNQSVNTTPNKLSGTGNASAESSTIDMTTNTSALGSRQSQIATATPALENRYGSLKVAPLVGLSTEKAYIDNTSGTGSIIYAYLGSGSIGTLGDAVRRLGGNVLAIETRNNILQNALRGDRVLFINIPNVTFVRVPTEERIHVAMIVYIGEDKWLIETPINRYHSSKATMKSLFEHLYQTVL